MPSWLKKDKGESRLMVEHRYEVALSFAGEQRTYVEEVARALQGRGISVFYDDFEQVWLWGKHGTEEFNEVFEHRASLAVMFISKEYVEKAWPRYEKQSILSRAVRERGEYVLPVRFDNTPVPGLPADLIHLNVEDYAPAKLAAMIAEKLGLNGVSGPVPTPTDEPERASLVKQTFEERQGLFESKLQAWFSECLERWKTLTKELAPDSVARFPKGYYATAYILADVQQPLEGAQLLEALRRGEVRHTGWPPFLVLTESDLKPYPYGGNVECWIGRTIQGDGPASADFWRVSPDGMFFLIRGYEEDGHEEKQIAPGTIFDISFPTWRLGEILLHASSMAHQFKSEDTKVLVKVEWTGLTKRRLASIANRNRHIFHEHISQQADYSANVEAQADQIAETLPELVGGIVRPLYEQFDFFKLPAKLVVEELTNMRKNQF